MIQSGGNEVLRSQIQAFAQRAEREGLDCDLRTYGGMPHVFQAYALGPCIEQSDADMRAFCERALAGTGS